MLPPEHTDFTEYVNLCQVEYRDQKKRPETWGLPAWMAASSITGFVRRNALAPSEQAQLFFLPDLLQVRERFLQDVYFLREAGRRS